MVDELLQPKTIDQCGLLVYWTRPSIQHLLKPSFVTMTARCRTTFSNKDLSNVHSKLLALVDRQTAFNIKEQ
jgi:hypothetical protein